jgi:hypothetical protein
VLRRAEGDILNCWVGKVERPVSSIVVTRVSAASDEPSLAEHQHGDAHVDHNRQDVADADDERVAHEGRVEGKQPEMAPQVTQRTAASASGPQDFLISSAESGHSTGELRTSRTTR